MIPPGQGFHPRSEWALAPDPTPLVVSFVVHSVDLSKPFTPGQWRGEGVFNMEQMDPDPFMDMLNEHGLPWQVKEMDGPVDF